MRETGPAAERVSASSSGSTRKRILLEVAEGRGAGAILEGGFLERCVESGVDVHVLTPGARFAPFVKRYERTGVRFSYLPVDKFTKYGFQLPPGVDGWLPAASSLASATELALLAAGAAAVAALLARELRPSPVGWLLLGLAVTGCWAPLEAASVAEVVAPIVVGALPAAAFALGIALLLKDDPRAFATAAAGIVLLPQGIAFLGSGVPSWALSGGLCLSVAGLVALARARGEAGARPPTPSPRAG